METFLIIAVGTIFMVALFGPFIVMMFQDVFEDVDISGKLSGWRGKRQNRKNRNKPIYERLALAHEWKAEQHLAQGRVERARDELRAASKVRKEAMEAMMNGDEPTI